MASWPSSIRTADLLAPFPMYGAFRRSEYYGASAPPCGHQPARACPPPDWLPGGKGNHKAVPTFTMNHSTRQAPSFTPAALHAYAVDIQRGLPTDLMRSASELTTPFTTGGHALHPGPYPPDLSRFDAYGASDTGSSRTPSRLDSRARAIWQY